MDVILKIIPSLAGVVIGGLITFFIQRNISLQQRKWERQKIELDNYQKETIKKLEVYNKVLQFERTKIILEVDIHNGEHELNKKNYNEFVRPLLFEYYHLLDEEIASEVDSIEDIFERQYLIEDEDDTDRESLSKSYISMISSMKKQFKKFRESRAKVAKKLEE